MDNCIILVNKERGVSSNKVVNTVKFLLQAKKAGHLGTLDVLGEGLLPVTIGKATKLFDYFLNKDKVYKTVFKFGETTDTLDLEGEIHKMDDKHITMDMVSSVLAEFIGKQEQMPPAFSAKKIKGKKAYELAREGKEVVLKRKEIEIYDIQCLRELEENKFEFLVHCSSGTYIRSLCRDLAQRLSTYGVMYAIQRTKCGIFDISNSYTIDDIKNNNFKCVMMDDVFDYQKIFLTKNQFEDLSNGKKVSYEKDGEYRAFYEDLFLGVVVVKDSNMKFKIRLF